MKHYQIVVAPTAEEDLLSILEWIEQEASLEKSKEWYASFKKKVGALESLPKRCPLAPENGLWGKEEIRQLLFAEYPSTYRVLFTMQNDTIQILNIRHGKRRYMHQS